MTTTKRTLTKLAFIAPAVLLTAVPGEASASSGDKKGNKGTKGGPAPAPRVTRAQIQIQPVEAPAPVPLTVPSGTDRLVSDRIRLHGKDGNGAGPVRVDLDGARPGTAYEVLYVPEGGSSRGQPFRLGAIRTDARGAFHGAAAEQMIPLEEAARAGTLVLRRLAGA